MERTIHQLTGDMKAGRNLEQALPELMNRMASAYGILSYYNMDMELSMLLESKAEGRIKPGKTTKELEETLYNIIRRTLLAPFAPEAYEEAVKELAELREKVIAKMDILTAYTDLFILYEYVMNRLEAVFEVQELLVPMDNDAVAKEILQWIFSEEEPALVNQHIKEMLSCLPVRMTKGKFLELVENAFSIYEKSDDQGVEMFDYMLRSAAGLYTPKGMAKSYSKLDKVKKLFESRPLNELTREEYEERKAALKGGTDYIRNTTECLGAVQAIANALMTVLLTKQYFTLGAEKAGRRPEDITRQLLSGEAADTEQLFAGIETEMETVSEEIMGLEPMLLLAKETMEKQIGELMLSAVYQRLLMVQRLNSGSAYASLTEESAEQEEGYLKKVKEAFLLDIRAALEEGSRIRNRAMMAAVLRELPVFFNNHTEVMNYVRNSLDGCRDEMEKKISVELLRSCYTA
ncbi:MAG: hypothetical protein J6A77_11000 [Lachnospiraceae bacterium]|nr:hypothetical protein [Lachnospiraceae bacterium]